MASQQVCVNYTVFTDLYGHVYQLNNINQGTYDLYMYYADNDILKEDWVKAANEAKGREVFFKDSILAVGSKAGFCYAKYMMEEVQWLPCQAVHAGEFFHGPLELIDKDFCVNVVVGISETRKMDARVVEFVKKYSDNYTIIDMKEFNLPHISKEFYYFVYPYVLNIYLDELAESFKPITGKNMETRRYYRKVSY